MDTSDKPKRDESCTTDNFYCEKHHLLFGVRRSIRYHNRRTQFFDRFHKISTFITALSGTATFAVALAKMGPKITLGFAFVVAVFSVVELVVSTAQQARIHNDLAKRFFDLEKAMTKEKNLTENALTDFTVWRLEIEADEPPPHKVLDSMCHNELCRAMGYDPSCFVNIKWYQRLFAQFIDISEHAINNPVPN